MPSPSSSAPMRGTSPSLTASSTPTVGPSRISHAVPSCTKPGSSTASSLSSDALDFIHAVEDKGLMVNQGAWCSQATNGGCSTSATQTTTVKCEDKSEAVKHISKELHIMCCNCRQ